MKIEVNARRVVTRTLFNANAAQSGGVITGGGAIELDGAHVHVPARPPARPPAHTHAVRGCAQVILRAGVEFRSNYVRNDHMHKVQVALGGAIYIHNPPATLMAVEHPSFVRNFCKGIGPAGGAISIDGEMHLEFATFFANSIVVDFEESAGGGAVAARGGSIILKNCSFQGNVAESRVFQMQNSGGALFVATGSKVHTRPARSPFVSA